MELANCRYCGELGFWGKAHTKCMAIAGEGRREIRAAIHAALSDDFSMGAIRRIVGDITVRSRIPEREARELVVEEYLRAVDGSSAGSAGDSEREDRLEELRRQFMLTRYECMQAAA
jgi:hypothetical protein